MKNQYARYTRMNKFNVCSTSAPQDQYTKISNLLVTEQNELVCVYV
jgi:hypothetical protein